MSTYGQKYAPWTRLVLVPIWVVQLFLLPVSVILLAILICVTEPAPDTVTTSSGDIFIVKPGVQPWNIVDLVIASVTLLVTCVEVLQFQFRELNPKFYMCSSMGKLVVWLIPVALTAYIKTTHWGADKYNAIYLYIAISFTALILASLIFSFLYSIWVFRRDRRRVRGMVHEYIASEWTSPAKYSRVQ